MAGSEAGVRARVHDSAGKPLVDLARTEIPVTGPVLEVAYELHESLEGATGVAIELLTGDERSSPTAAPLGVGGSAGRLNFLVALRVQEEG